ncbi:IS200/IS605 family transposase [Anaerobacillus alkalidiazotrophicus]|uniref:IS200/IS605 family transposase n=1 Tax=Anaerobacillus alkalidiazotrophicus TaxID=472963 RepID=A0A1S2M3W6_9BACI|nr:IS200/IS605 family transposase [Anaerobacillus alkalidiazotrophicus]OIJ18305.1 IS200/IS605 family transposase [Anaerobacillus alkalidiazotrophicus]OIJ19784.1 IS200/IS605 family transposase [Anaerobacillus alkalidiazotrophicus]
MILYAYFFGISTFEKNSHAVFDIKFHVIWMTKYRYKELHGANVVRTQELISQRCKAREITILQGSVGKVYIHLLLSHPPSLSPSKIMQYLKGRSSRLHQEQFPELKKKNWGQHLWARGYFCATVGTVDEETI